MQQRRDLVIGIQGARFTPVPRKKENAKKRTPAQRRSYRQGIKGVTA